MAITIAQVPTEIVEDPRQYLTLIHGDAGVGKTTWCSQIPGHYFALCSTQEANGLKVFGSVITSWEEFKELLSLIVTTQQKRTADVRQILTLIVDPADLLYQYCCAWVCKNTAFMDKGTPRKYDRIENVPWGGGYKEAANVFLTTIHKFMGYGFGVVLNAHTKEKVVQWRGQDITVFAPNFPGSAAERIVDDSGAVGYFTKEEITEKDMATGMIKIQDSGRYAYWQKTFQRVAKHKLMKFPEKLPLCNAVGEPTGYEIYVKAFREAAGSASETVLAVD